MKPRNRTEPITSFRGTENKRDDRIFKNLEHTLKMLSNNQLEYKLEITHLSIKGKKNKAKP